MTLHLSQPDSFGHVSSNTKLKSLLLKTSGEIADDKIFIGDASVLLQLLAGSFFVPVDAATLQPDTGWSLWK
jgi:hypothetical protein